MKIAIDSPCAKITAASHSHNAAWAYITKHQLETVGNEITVLHNNEDWNEYDIVYLFHGIAFNGALNLFGGANEENAMMFERLLSYRGKFISLNIPMPDYGTMCKNRSNNCHERWKLLDFDKMTELAHTTTYVRHPIMTNSMVLGDSHAPSVYKSGQMVARIDCKTMHGALKFGLSNLIESEGIKLETLNQLTLYFGNIDLRHHICRMDNPTFEITKMLEEYEIQILNLGINEIELVECLPMPNDSRKLPKTGYYKKEPFHGSWIDRSEAVMNMNVGLEKIAKKNNWNFYQHPKWIKNCIGELSFDAMERPKSVHLSPIAYRTDIRNIQNINDDMNSLEKFF